MTNRVASTTLLLPDCPRLSPHLPGKTPTRTCWRPWGLPCFLRQARGPSASSGIPCRPSRHVTVFATTDERERSLIPPRTLPEHVLYSRHVPGVGNPP